jgi:hypothetical protein
LQYINYEHNPYSGVEEPRDTAAKRDYKQTRKRTSGNNNRWKSLSQDFNAIRQDAAFSTYLSHIANSRRNNGKVSKATELKAVSGTRRFLQFLNVPIADKALSGIIAETRQRHRNDDFRTDDNLLRFVNQKPTQSYATWGAAIKGIFKANRTLLYASFNTTFTHATKKISSGILKAIFETLPIEE